MCYHHANHIHRVLEAERESSRAAADRRDAAAREALRARNQVIYYAKVGGHIKIGWTSDLAQRMRSYPPNTELLAVHPGSRDDERQLHRRFAVHRSHGAEWYPLMPVILGHIDEMIAQHGKPPAVPFGARPVDVKRRPKDKPTLHVKTRPTLHG